MPPSETLPGAHDAPHDSKRQIEAALDWWRQAGLSVDTVDEATRWLDAETSAPTPAATEQTDVRVARKKAPPPVKLTGGDRITVAKAEPVAGSPEDWPQELAAFQAWWAGKKDSAEKDAAVAQAPQRIAPRGPADADTLFLVAQPEADDTEQLLDGPRGALLNAIMRAMGLAEGDAYLASALPAHSLQPDWDDLAASGYGALVRHHIALAAPQRIIVFGRRILPLIAHELAQDAAILAKFNHEGSTVPLLAAPDLGSLLRSAGQRKRFWQQWLEWTDRK